MDIQSISTIAVLGTGNMGPGIALQFARAGYRVNLWGWKESSVEKGIANLYQNLDDLVRAGILTGKTSGEVKRLTMVSGDLEATVASAQFVVEAIPENLELKQEIFSRLEGICSPETILASNTSTLLPTPLSATLQHKERLIVAHFWNPAYLAPLVEVCGSPLTSPDVIKTTMDLLKKVGNEPVLMRKEVLGFIGNRIMHAMNREALALIGAGVCDPEDIDRVVHSSFGPRFANLGPMEYLDFSGLDLIRSIQGYLYNDLDNTPGVLPIIEELVAEGKLGKKTGEGLFDWSEKEDRIRENRDKELMRRNTTQQN